MNINGGSKNELFFSVCSPQSMTARLEVFDSKINDYKNENQTLTNELTSFKKKYFSQKKLYRWAHNQPCEPVQCVAAVVMWISASGLSALLCSTSEQQAKIKDKEPEAQPQRSSEAHVQDGLTRIDTLSIWRQLACAASANSTWQTLHLSFIHTRHVRSYW